MTRRTLLDRAREAGERFAERQHGRPREIGGKRYPTPAAFAATLAFAAGWLAGHRAGRKR